MFLIFKDVLENSFSPCLHFKTLSTICNPATSRNTWMTLLLKCVLEMDRNLKIGIFYKFSATRVFPEMPLHTLMHHPGVFYPLFYRLLKSLDLSCTLGSLTFTPNTNYL